MGSNNTLPYSSPEAEGIPSAAILGFVQAAEEKAIGLHSLMLLRHGRVVASGWWSPYAAEHPHMLFSLSKSFTSTGVGLAVSAGLLSVDDPVISFFPDDLPDPVSPNLAAMRVRHLLTMTTGHTADTTEALFQREDGNWARAFLACPVEREPGTHFLYNTGATYMLSAIVQKVTGQTLLDYLQERLFAPLGIEGATWETCPRGINTGGFGLSVKTEDIARFGQLYLQKGLWRGQRIIPAAWVEEATAYQVSNAGTNKSPEWVQGYGYQFWRCRHNVYRGDGAFGQFCIVMPEQEAVLAITSGTPNMQGVLDLVWEHLLPAMGPAPLAEEPKAQERLRAKLATLMLPPVAGEPSSPWAARASGRAYLFPENEEGLESVSFDFSSRLLVARQRGVESRLTWGERTWVLGQHTVLHAPWRGERLVAASAAWSGLDTFKLALCSYETPFCGTITCRFAGDELTYDLAANVSFGPTQAPTLTGRAAAVAK